MHRFLLGDEAEIELLPYSIIFSESYLVRKRENI